MTYVSLYRKYRPRTFGDVVGQDHVTRTLANAIDEDRLSHAYLFTGPRGTGKTSTARILAKAINCVTGPTSEPCDVCEQCTAIADGSSVDVIELDMASHGGVDDARELRERALFSPANARRKVYILDEVHMASTAAFNALLKLIEEPPAHVLFAMATTDPQKVIPTILSRVQRLDLRRVGAVQVAEHVAWICGEEGYSIDDDAIAAVVRAGDGSVRDTLSVLEQVLAYAGRDVSAEAVAQTLGTTPAQQLLRAVELIADQDVAGLLDLVHGLLASGHDLRRFTLDLVGHLRDLLVLQVAGKRPELVDATEQWRLRLQEQAGLLPESSLLRAVQILADTLTQMRQSAPRLPLELALATLATPAAGTDLSGLSDRIARLERRLVDLEGDRDHSPATKAVPASNPPRTAPPAERPAPAPSPATPAAEPVAPVSAERVRPDVAEAPAERAEPTAAAEPATDSGTISATERDTTSTNDQPTTAETVAIEPDHGGAGATEASRDSAEPDDVFSLVQSRWDGVLEILKERSRRHHAIFEPAIPLGVSRGILILGFGPRYASFHAVQARTGELSASVTQALEQACGVRLKIDVKVDGEDARRRPMPPDVTPSDARTPVLDEPGETADDASEGLDVREAELGGSGPDRDVDSLLVTELGAQLLEEGPAGPTAGP